MSRNDTDEQYDLTENGMEEMKAAKEYFDVLPR
jgi:hypothetical protein